MGDDQGGTSNTEEDLRMLCYSRGRSRTLDQLGDLAKSAGLEVSSIIPGPRSIIEMLPSHLAMDSATVAGWTRLAR